jgi:hypothetical protein
MANDAAALLAELIANRGAPKHLRSDNGPEFIAEALRGFLRESNIETLHIESGSPWQNGFSESFHARVKDERIKVELFRSMREAEVVGGDWREAYNKICARLLDFGGVCCYTTNPQNDRRGGSPGQSPGTSSSFKAGKESEPGGSHSRWYIRWGQVNRYPRGLPPHRCAEAAQHHPATAGR